MNESIDVAEVLRGVWGQEAALKALLAKIVASHPDDSKSTRKRRTLEARVGVAMDALLATPKSRRGPKEQLSDDKLLDEVASRFFENFFTRAERPSVQRAVREVLSTHPLHSKMRRKDAFHNKLRALVKKFKKHQDELLVRHSHRNEEAAVNFRRKLLAAEVALAALGIIKGT